MAYFIIPFRRRKVAQVSIQYKWIFKIDRDYIIIQSRNKYLKTDIIIKVFLFVMIKGIFFKQKL
jgi:hypothetical protein